MKCFIAVRGPDSLFSDLCKRSLKLATNLLLKCMYTAPVVLPGNKNTVFIIIAADASESDRKTARYFGFSARVV